MQQEASFHRSNKDPNEGSVRYGEYESTITDSAQCYRAIAKLREHHGHLTLREFQRIFRECASTD